MSQPKNPPVVHDDFETIERYVVTTFARYERALVTRIPTLAEPRVIDPDLALVRLRWLVETLGGFAVGAAVGAVARTTHTAEASDRIRDRIEAEESSPTELAGEILSDVINPLSLFSGGTLNEGEELQLDIDMIVSQVIIDVIADIEAEGQHSLGQEERAAIEALVRSSLGVGMGLEDPESE